MNWIGKLGGGALGLLVGGPLGAVVGAVLGHQFDRGFGGGGARRRRQRARLDPAADALFFESLFLVMGHLAKADGRVSEVEIAAARQMMRQLRLDPGRQREAIALFNRGKPADFPLRVQLRRLSQAIGAGGPLARAFLQAQLDFVLETGQMERRQRLVVNQVADELGLGRVELAQLEALARARRGFGWQRPRRAADAADGGLAHAFKVLGLEASASDEEVQRAYRRLMNRHHPDKQLARGGSPEELKRSAERTREIRGAYELIRERRRSG
ncbi:MAG: co-chaperone DjlA [Chromatiales bacterium]|nr:co-chaperone DjlA [Chromatiales bacterium]